MCKCLMRNKHQQCQPLNIRVFECESNRRNSRWMARKHPNHIWDSELLHFTNFVLLLCNSSTYFLLLLFVILFSFYCFCFWSVTSPLSIVLPMTMPVPFVSWFSFNVIACRVCVQSLPTSWTTVMLQFDCCCMLGFFFASIPSLTTFAAIIRKQLLRFPYFIWWQFISVRILQTIPIKRLCLFCLFLCRTVDTHEQPIQCCLPFIFVLWHNVLPHIR